MVVRGFHKQDEQVQASTQYALYSLLWVIGFMVYNDLYGCFYHSNLKYKTKVEKNVPTVSWQIGSPVLCTAFR